MRRPVTVARRVVLGLAALATASWMAAPASAHTATVAFSDIEIGSHHITWVLPIWIPSTPTTSCAWTPTAAGGALAALGAVVVARRPA